MAGTENEPVLLATGNLLQLGFVRLSWVARPQLGGDDPVAACLSGKPQLHDSCQSGYVGALQSDVRRIF